MAAHLAQRDEERCGLLFVEIAQHVGLDRRANFSDRSQVRSRGSCQEYSIGPSVCGIGVTLHQSRLRQLVDQTRECDRLHFQHVRQVDLANALVAGQVNECPRLRQGEGTALQSVLESLPHHPGNVSQQET